MFYSKWTFSLTSLIVMFALVLVASPAMAQFEIKLSVGDGPADSTASPPVLGGDVSHADGNQVQYTQTIGINIMSTKVVNFHATATAATAAADPPTVSGTALGTDDFMVIAYNKFGGTVATPPALTVVTAAATPDGMHFMLTV